mgnify:FL=1
MFALLKAPTKLLRKNMRTNTAYNFARRSEGVIESEILVDHSREISRTLSLESLYSRRNFLAAGSFGEIHRVVRKADNHHMAMKVLNLKEAHDNEHQMPVIVHNHFSPSKCDTVIKVDQMFVERNQMFIIFDFMKGMDMLDYLLEIGQCTEDLSVRLIRRILKCVSDCHVAGVAHLDIKPDNLMFREEAEDGKLENFNPDGLTLVDFGSARLLSSEEEHLGVDQGTGTVGYVAPEILTDRGSIASDMWSVGVVSYMIMMGKMPFPMGQKGVEMTMKGKFKQDDKWHALSPCAKDFVSNLLVVDPSERLNVNEALEHSFLQDATSSCVVVE